MDFSKQQIIYHSLNQITVIYVIRNGVTSFTCVPTSTLSKVKESKLYKDFNKKYPYCEIEPLVQVSCVGDRVRRDFSEGVTLFNSETAFAFRVYDQQVVKEEGQTKIITFLKTPSDLFAKHVVMQKEGYNCIEVFVELENKGAETSLNLASSFAISSLTPFEEENDPESLILHRLHNNWAGEGWLDSACVSQYNFEDSWSSLGVRVQKIGALGSMTARGYVPFIALEDDKNKVTWALQLEAPGSWQIEAIHRYNGINLVGGQADYTYGHWRKTLKSGEKYLTTKALITTAVGNLTKACANLTRYHDNYYHIPQVEQDLPIVYNEYLYSWGNPTMQNVLEQMEFAKELNCSYFVLDAGWFCPNNCDKLGDWDCVSEKFPNGLIEFTNKLKQEGFLAGGVWYEFESVTDNANVNKNANWLLTANGQLIDHFGRRFLDFRKQEVTDYLTQKVIDNLNKNNLKYIKIDYNDNIGFAVDGAESEGEGLRQHMQKVVEFFKKLRANVPGLIMEVCSSGGMRHDLLFSTLGSMVSFSDAHENADGAIVAINLHRIMQPRTMQIWASYLPQHDIDEVYFTTIKAMIGRICLSGHLEKIHPDMIKIVKDGINYYQNLKEIIKSGETILIDTSEIKSLRNPKGVCKLVRKSADSNQIVCYAFAYDCNEREIFFSESQGYELTSFFGNVKTSATNDKAFILGGKRLSAVVAIYTKK